MEDNQTTVLELQEEKLALQNVVALIRVVLLENSIVLVSNHVSALHYQLQYRYHTHTLQPLKPGGHTWGRAEEGLHPRGSFVSRNVDSRQ